MSEIGGPSPESEVQTPVPELEMTPSDEATRIIEGVSRVFPEYSIVDRAEWDTYVAEDDSRDSGKKLKFFTSVGSGSGHPEIQVVTHPRRNLTGFAFNQNNTPDLRTKVVRFVNNSFLGPHMENWQVDDIELAAEKSKIQTVGIDPESEDIMNQIVRWSQPEGRFITMRDRVAAHAAKKNRLTGWKQKTLAAGENYIWDLYKNDPAKATELAIERIKARGAYKGFSGEDIPVDAILAAISSGSSDGFLAVRRELNMIDAQEELLRIKSGLL